MGSGIFVAFRHDVGRRKELLRNKNGYKEAKTIGVDHLGTWGSCPWWRCRSWRTMHLDEVRREAKSQSGSALAHWRQGRRSETIRAARGHSAVASGRRLRCRRGGRGGASSSGGGGGRVRAALKVAGIARSAKRQNVVLASLLTAGATRVLGDALAVELVADEVREGLLVVLQAGSRVVGRASAVVRERTLYKKICQRYSCN